MSDPTARQLEILCFIESHTHGLGYPPSIREIVEAFGLASTNGVAEHLDALTAKGLLLRATRTARGMRVTPLGLAFLEGAAL